MNFNKYFLIYLTILMLSFTQSYGKIHKEKEFISIHQIQLKEYKNFVPEPLKSEKFFSHFTKGETTPRVKKQVLGYYTYWKTGTANLKWDLLTIIAYFSAEIDSNGNITTLNGWPSSAPINEAHSHGVKVILTATLFGGSSIRTLIQSESNRQNCIQNLYNQVESAGADGICIDFELPYSSDREYFNTFIQELSDYFHTNMPESLVVVDTPAVNWNDRMDFNTLTDYADYLFIMAYDYHYSGGDPGPVSPLSYTDGSPWPTWAGIVQTLDDYIYGTYGVGDTKKNKLILGVPYYGYDWPAQKCEIPTKQRANASAVIYSTAVDKAGQYNREWDDYSQTPFYDYNCSTSYPHQAWYDDEISIGLKYDKVNQYNIGGTGMWALNYDGTRTELWQTIREKFGFFYITATAGENGNISPSGKVMVDYGQSMIFTITPDNGYHIKDVTVDGVSQGAINSYTFSNVTQDHTISASFEQDQPSIFTITATSTQGGTIMPSGQVEVNAGDSITFTIKPLTGYQIDYVDVDGINQGAITSYTFKSVTTNHTIDAFFKENTVNTYTINATASTGGSIQPSGNVIVNNGDNITFAITPDYGYRIKDVFVDGQSVGIVNEYTFNNVQRNHTIHAEFIEVSHNKYQIKATAEGGGSIYPSGTIEVTEGESKTFSIVADPGYTIEKVEVDGVSQGRINSYTFKQIYKDHTIHAKFIESLAPELISFTASNLSGLTPLTVDFYCQFTDPGNRKIVKYYWQVEGDYSGVFESEEPSISLTFYNRGTYYIKVVAENELKLKGESYCITILPINFGNYPISVNGELKLNDRKISINSYLINPIASDARISIKKISPDGSAIAKNYNLKGYTKVKISDLTQENLNELFQYSISTNSFVLIYSDISGENLGAAAYQGLASSPILYIPHIAEETYYWDTLLSIGNKNQKNLIITVNNEGISYNSQISNIFNITNLANNIPEPRCWGQIIDSNMSNVLNGFEIFIQKENDGAAITLENTVTNKFFIPHVPEEKDLFWTGFAFINTENKDGKITFYLYNNNGKLIKIKSIDIPAYSKVKGLFSKIFGEDFSEAVWGYAYSSVEVTGIEIYGISGGAICGYTLPTKNKSNGIFPIASSNDKEWTGMVALNPNSENAFVTFTLYDGKGNALSTKQIKIPPFTRYKTLIKDLFPENSFSQYCFIKYNSNRALICLEVNGDNERTYMKSLIAY